MFLHPFHFLAPGDLEVTPRITTHRLDVSSRYIFTTEHNLVKSQSRRHNRPSCTDGFEADHESNPSLTDQKPKT
jgi:hypothetical protein